MIDSRARRRTRWLIALIYVPFGVLHIMARHSFLPIMPPGIPQPLAVIVFTGLCEIAGGIGLVVPATRRVAGTMLALYAICVWPANLYHAFSGVSVPPLPSSWWYHGPRLLLQPVLIWAPLWASGVLGWPFRRTPISQH
ncbi:MAG: hypothetical protein JWM33_3174 [Caulobacteraceae bacterium]|nr:hypothetical protein [Caulobacteraceae bacterium]